VGHENTATLILLRHGESEWNAKNLFTGWVDVDLNEKGTGEAQRGGELLVESGLLPDVVHTSVQVRAIRTAELVLVQVRADQPIAQREVYVYGTTSLRGATLVHAQDGGHQ